MDSKTNKKLENIIRETLGVDIKRNLSMDNISGWDSLKHIQLLARIEKEFDIEFDFQETLKMTDLNSIKEIVKKHISGK